MTPLSEEQASVICAYTGILCGSFSAFHEYAERVLGRPVYTHEFASQEVADELKEAARPDFMDLIPGRAS